MTRCTLCSETLSCDRHPDHSRRLHIDTYTFISWPSSNNRETIRDRHPDMPLTSPHTSRSHRISAPSGTTGSPSGGGVACSGSSRTLGSPCMNAFSPAANVPSDGVDARICSVMLMDDSSGVGQLRSISWISGSLKPCTHHLALALRTQVSVSFQRRTRREEITLSLCFSLITSACVESMMVAALKSSTPCHSVSIAFENCVCSSAERCFQDTTSAFRRLR